MPIAAFGKEKGVRIDRSRGDTEGQDKAVAATIGEFDRSFAIIVTDMDGLDRSADDKLVDTVIPVGSRIDAFTDLKAFVLRHHPRPRLEDGLRSPADLRRRSGGGGNWRAFP
ncbi:hypothetical protein U0C82_09325 [Fulvimarina sp. 2208YS6-2-32]|uniref:Uncharacterized protein n=1 Tax=Fulvimarina uroteuthidis TaxID=3098149 RepID=A0ABU5I1Z0_9HYPH|nr:hypothetical protein [Fulvimarina sp. 2208YS6-2-32]MDY8109340.1 hypothetical protein [Fulvimarina sp. 2208YS6-2-32]